MRRLIVDQSLPVESLHLFAGAIDPDFERNGLNDAMRAGRIRSAHVYFSNGDCVLKWFAGASRGLYGRLGYTGPRNVFVSVRLHGRVKLGQSDWFGPDEFERSMRFIDAATDDLPY